MLFLFFSLNFFLLVSFTKSASLDVCIERTSRELFTICSLILLRGLNLAGVGHLKTCASGQQLVVSLSQLLWQILVRCSSTPKMIFNWFYNVRTIFSKDSWKPAELNLASATSVQNSKHTALTKGISEFEARNSFAWFWIDLLYSRGKGNPCFDSRCLHMKTNLLLK